jgi:hypothetical protein
VPQGKERGAIGGRVPGWVHRRGPSSLGRFQQLWWVDSTLKSRREASVKIRRSGDGLSCVRCTLAVAREAVAVPRGGRTSKSIPASPTLRWRTRRCSDDDDESRHANARHGVPGRAKCAPSHLERRWTGFMPRCRAALHRVLIKLRVRSRRDPRSSKPRRYGLHRPRVEGTAFPRVHQASW